MVKTINAFIGLVCMFVVGSVFAASYVQPSSKHLHDVKPTKAKIHKVCKTRKIRKSHQQRVSFVARNGFLLANVKRFARQFHYRLIWNVKDPNSGEHLDYRWLGTQKFSGDTAMDIFHVMIHPYPVIVNVWKTNRVIEISNESSTF